MSNPSNIPADVLFGEYLVNQKLLTAEQWRLVDLEHRATGASLAKVVSSLGFMRHEALVAAMVAVNSEELYLEERFTNKLSSDLLLSLETMVVAELGDTLYVATMRPIELVRQVLEAQAPSLVFVFVPCFPDHLSSYLNKLKAKNTQAMLLEDLLQRAAAKRVSDIHIIPKENSYLVSFRYLGVRYPVHEGALIEHAHLTSRVKDLARLDLAERRVPQDGSFSFEYDARRIDLRIATVPTAHGEYVVIRLLDPENAAPSLDGLGITALSDWQKGISRSDGLCLICGPTGSGKTTTLNASVAGLDRVGSAVFTVEDPVEYRIPLTGQVSIIPAIGLDFSRALKAFMRADPDVIVLGEVRDTETAKSSLKAAETGHLVLATLHTESIYGASQRLKDLGVPEAELAHLLRSVLVQRLVRVACKHCHGQGCERCEGYGYTGRTVVSECAYFRNVAEVRRMLNGERWWPTLLEDAVAKARAGITTQEEVIRLFGEEASELFDSLKTGGSM